MTAGEILEPCKVESLSFCLKLVLFVCRVREACVCGLEALCVRLTEECPQLLTLDASVNINEPLPF